MAIIFLEKTQALLSNTTGVGIINRWNGMPRLKTRDYITPEEGIETNRQARLRNNVQSLISCRNFIVNNVNVYMSVYVLK